MSIASLSALALAVVSPVQAAPACPDGSVVVPAELAGWSTMMPVVAAMDAAAAPALTIGTGARATLAPIAALHVAHALDTPATPGTFGGLFALTVTTAGRYRIALGASAWIDVVAGDRTLRSVAHDHGPACSPVRKMVDFDLAPGRYVVQIAGAKAAGLPLIVAGVAR